MQLSQILPILEEIAPAKYAESWDNVGLLAGNPAQEVRRILLTIDYTDPVAAEARDHQCDLVIAYHPPIFNALKRITAPSLIFDAIRNGIALYSPHTALDVAEGGTNDLLADALGLTQRWPLKLAETKTTQYKLVTFVPEEALEKVSSALFTAGAGRIGAYSSCSFRSPGTGTFLGDESTTPAVGQKGKLEQVAEVRLETVVPISKVEEAIRALRTSHPYEEPAFDLNQLAAPPQAIGIGRSGTLPPTPREVIFERIKQTLGLNHLLIAGPVTGPITRAACCAGACGELLDDALREKAELYLTGEMRHHDALKAAARGMTVVCTLHSNSERAVLQRLTERLKPQLPGIDLLLSRADRDPFQIA
jgi:dinuclear metal center YbgI/SA1388 family protein